MNTGKNEKKNARVQTTNIYTNMYAIGQVVNVEC